MSSTDLELIHQDLPNIKLSPITIQTPEPSEAPSVVPRTLIQRRKDDDNDDDNKDNEDLCRTPTSERHRIPKILTCPPAPRKPARRVPSCKRKLTELQFFDVKNREDVEEFFRSSFEINVAAGRRSSAKRSCCPCK